MQSVTRSRLNLLSALTVLAIVVALCIGAAAVSKTRSAKPRNNAPGVSAMVTINEQQFGGGDTKAPFEIARVTVEGKDVRSGEAFLAESPVWLKTMAITIKNTSSKTIKQVSVALRFAGSTIGSHEIARGRGYISEASPKGGQELLFAPGESLTLRPTENQLKWLDSAYKAQSAALAAVTLSPSFAVYEDTKTAWFDGGEGFLQDDGRMLWLYNDSDFADPEVQRVLDGKPRPEKPRWDENSKQFVLDSLSCVRKIGFEWKLCPPVYGSNCDAYYPNCKNKDDQYVDTAGTKLLDSAIKECYRLVGGEYVNCNVPVGTCQGWAKNIVNPC